MAETREKLLELLQSGDCPLILCCGGMDRLANYLIANGVTIPVRCKNCECDGSCSKQDCGNMGADDFCSHGRERLGRNVQSINS